MELSPVLMVRSEFPSQEKESTGWGQGFDEVRRNYRKMGEGEGKRKGRERVKGTKTFVVEPGSSSTRYVALCTAFNLSVPQFPQL